MHSSLFIVQADLDRPEHQQAVLDLTAAYALDDMGNGGPLSQEVLGQLIPALKSHPTTLILLAYLDDRPVGIATCFLGFSTFLAMPLVNIHDLAVLPEFRGQGVGCALLQAVDRKALELGCGKVTLEVLENNHRVRRLYEQAGFKHATYTDAGGGVLFYSKKL